MGKKRRIGVLRIAVWLLPILVILIFIIYADRRVDAAMSETIEVCTSRNPAGKGPKPEILSKAAALYDFETGTLLFEKNGDQPISPASMTKLMSLHLAYRAIERGRLSRSTMVTVGAPGDFRSQPSGSSLMFIEKGQRVSIIELMKGLAVPSGNDAAVSLARAVSGTVEAFVEDMNSEARRLGLEDVHFTDPAGIDGGNRVTAKSFGQFALTYIAEHPHAIEELHSLTDFTYPEKSHIPAGRSSAYGAITQENYNLLVGRHPWVDGLKTGYIEESGYNITVTAEKNGRRLVAAVLGGPGESTREGQLSRVIDGTNLISYGFYAFRKVEPAAPTFPATESAESAEPTEPAPKPPATESAEPAPRLRIWGGDTPSVSLSIPEPSPVLVPAESAELVRSRVNLSLPLIAPVEKGEKLGTLTVVIPATGDGITDPIRKERTLAAYPVRAAETVDEAPTLQRLYDLLTLEAATILP